MEPVKIKITDFLEFLKNNKMGKNNFSDFIANDSAPSSTADTDYNDAEIICLYDPDPKTYIRYDFNLYIQENEQFPNLTTLIFDKNLLMSNICININRAIDLDIYCNVENTNIELIFNRVFNDSSSDTNNVVNLGFYENLTKRIYVNNLIINNMLEEETLKVHLRQLTSNNILIKETLDLRNITLTGISKLVPLKDIYMKNLINGKDRISAGNLAYSNYVENLEATYTLGNEVTGEQEGMKIISHPVCNFEELDDPLSKSLFENKLNHHNHFSSFLHFFLPLAGYDNMSIEVVQSKEIKKSKLIFKSMFLTAKTGYTLVLGEDAIFEITRIFKKVTIENSSSHLALVDKDNEFWRGDRLLLKAGTVLSLLPASNYSIGSKYLETKNFINN